MITKGAGNARITGVKAYNDFSEFPTNGSESIIYIDKANNDQICSHNAHWAFGKDKTKLDEERIQQVCPTLAESVINVNRIPKLLSVCDTCIIFNRCAT